MSIEAVDRFLTKTHEDQQLQTEVSQAMSAKNSSQAITELAAKHGYKFSQQEFDLRIKKLKDIQAKSTANGELNEEELEAVAGGVWGAVAGAASAAAAAIGLSN